ncbi:carboxypeptidase-like regulatory domain-containing protein [Mucilaginibacter sp. UR6-11]|uniref:carboxypeptidase-like regulatory domain-containing protein n=1 Tax=Mucilaginibacter sp. UR6-11 TaxID=1435644 RepID=UPI001E3C2051|nr:carboxypeptidase-like regulatory domain-containing protein [Mucilaginibacter sp. UR6-11]MCC8426761.1 carboxypeptidase-like regulatory domain-containing protein [Mucilaginibacter sp. UR6-11]
MKKILALFVFVLFQLNTYAQHTYTITGTVKNSKGEKIQSATVFIAGSEKITITDGQGYFKFNTIAAGTYQLVVNMLGYASAKQNVIVKDKSETVELTLGEKEILLGEVVIGDKSIREKHLKTFVKYFMGQSDNAKYCKIINPELLEFSTAKSILKATTSDFLIIENSTLGYRIKYLLKLFQYDHSKDVTNYEGDCIFEQLNGTPQQQLTWQKNRKEAYEGSLMHYLRSLYAGTSRKEGFLVYKILSPFFPLVIESIPIVAEQIVKHPDSTLMVFRYNKMRFYVLFDKKKAAKEDGRNMVSDITLENLDYTGSIFMTDAQIDRRGSYSDYKTLLIQGFWGRKRIADQLPLEYVPD